MLELASGLRALKGWTGIAWNVEHHGYRLIVETSKRLQNNELCCNGEGLFKL
jgi:hypothetical protein